jgi:hypothetical protein
MGIPIASEGPVPKFEDLSPSSPLRDFKLFVSNSPDQRVRNVKLNTGGQSRRSREHILSDLNDAIKASGGDAHPSLRPTAIADDPGSGGDSPTHTGEQTQSDLPLTLMMLQLLRGSPDGLYLHHHPVDGTQVAILGWHALSCHGQTHLRSRG